MRHDFDPWSLMLGLVFGLVAVAGLNGLLDDVLLDPASWSAASVVPILLIVLGLVVGSFAVTMLRRRPVEPATGPVEGDHDDA